MEEITAHSTGFTYECCYCSSTPSLDFKGTILHVIHTHPDKEIKVRRIKGKAKTIINYRVCAELCREQGRTITIDEENRRIHISKRDVAPKDSPFKKIVKTENLGEKYFCSSDISSQFSEEEVSEDTGILTELVEILPSVIESLKRCGKLDDFIAFNRLVHEDTFPLDNIAFLLFLDVVRWFALQQPTTLFRYSDECTLFWNTGYKLFRGRFLRFMGGPKHKGQEVEENGIPGQFSSDTSNINFVVPSKKCLKDECRMVPVQGPGIIKNMIEIIAENDREQILTYKICVDGKKINASSQGAVNLWGYEAPPSFDMKSQRLKEEIETLRRYLKLIERQISLSHVLVSDLHIEERELLHNRCKSTVGLLSNRIKDLRELKVKKVLALKKFQMKCEGDWRNSTYAMVISSIRTSIYRIENCIEDMLNTNENICKAAAVSAQSNRGCFVQKDEVELQNQQNYVCLAEVFEPEGDASIVKQRSEEWFKIRKECFVTGSAINKAIGLNGLKSQRDYFETKTGRKEPEEVSKEMQARFDYGSQNELNAVATICSTFLPAFHPEASFYEEGCYVLKSNETPYLVVSPDGSLRKHDDHCCIYTGIEIKCPMPGKEFTTPVHYNLPHYYVSQVLSEMHSLNVDSLYFVSYSKQSTAIHNIRFSGDLWSEILEEIKHLDINHTPRRLGLNIEPLRMKVKNFCSTNTSLVAELKSKIGKTCSHSSEERGRIFHKPSKIIKETVLLQDIQRSFTRAIEAIEISHNLCSNKASEVLVFLLADLDRMYKPDVPHAFPVAYAFKGYSMTSESMRKMIQDVLKELFIQGLYTSVVSYDGQWASLAFKDEHGDALTLLELQKQVYNDIKKRTKCELTGLIFNMASVNSNSYVELLEKIKYTYDSDKKSLTIATKAETKLFKTSEYMCQLLRNNKEIKKMRKKDNNVDSSCQTESNIILSSLPVDILETMDADEVEAIKEAEGAPDPVNLTAAESGLNEDMNEVLDTMFSVDEDISEINVETEKTDNTVMRCIDSDQMLTENTVETMLGRKETMGMLLLLKSDEKVGKKWTNIDQESFESYLSAKSSIEKHFTNYEIIKCITSAQSMLHSVKLKFAKSWSKAKLSEFLFSLHTKKSDDFETDMGRIRRKRTPDKLKNLCKKTISKLPKALLNAVIAENLMPEKIEIWRRKSPFSPITKLGDTELTWFSCPEYNPGTLSYIFSFIDVHHLLTNCRVKVCKDGIPARGISRQAWLDVAKSNTTNLRLPHVEDLIDKQSDAIARETFSKDVENFMKDKYPREAKLCRLMREFYEAEDDPGITVYDRSARRLALRDWLLDGVNFCQFPPYGSHINGIPNIMFQGFLTNIDRRLQLFPYVKCGSYNVRSLGSLEAENLFGQFQDLDPKGTGVVKAEEVPAALEAACQLLKVRLLPDRPFHMTLSKQKVYPVHELLAESETAFTSAYLYPWHVSEITLKNHMFDVKARGKRKAKRKIVTVSGPDDAARGVQGVRQFHKYDESKILPHKRLGIDL